MTLRRVGLSNSLSSQAKISNKRFTLSRVSLRRFPFPTVTGPTIIPNYIEEVFSTYLYTAGGSSITVSNQIDLLNNGGAVWTKSKATQNHVLAFSTSGTGTADDRLFTSSSDRDQGNSNGIDYNATGFTVGSSNLSNSGTGIYVSWTFRNHKKFFDHGSYSGNGTSRVISHKLSGVPGMIWIKQLSNNSAATRDWVVWHRSLATNHTLVLNSSASSSSTSFITNVTNTGFTIAAGNEVNSSSDTYAYFVFAHNDGGFGPLDIDNVISCGSFTTDGSGNATVSLGYEPQWVMTKRTDSTGNWTIVDVMRGMTVNAGSTGNAGLYADSSAPEIAGIGLSALPNATGMTYSNVGPSRTFIYIAIRRGPMKTPTSGTSVFTPTTWTSTNVDYRAIDVGFAADMYYWKRRDSTDNYIGTRLQGINRLVSTDTAAEASVTNSEGFDGRFQNSITASSGGATAIYNSGTSTNVFHAFRRAPGFFDIVCYTGTGSNRTVSHNLGVAPELIIVKNRVALTSETGDWSVYAAPLTATNRTFLNLTAATNSSNQYWNDTEPTSSVFTVGINGRVNENTKTYVAYLFASCPGVSKVGSYTGTGTTLQVNCGFTSGARFVLIKRTDSTGDWYVWDSARGIIAGNDPYFLYNSAAVEVTGTDYIDTYSPGFEISSTAPAAINANGGTYIFLAIA